LSRDEKTSIADVAVACNHERSRLDLNVGLQDKLKSKWGVVSRRVCSAL